MRDAVAAAVAAVGEVITPSAATAAIKEVATASTTAITEAQHLKILIFWITAMVWQAIDMRQQNPFNAVYYSSDIF